MSGNESRRANVSNDAATPPTAVSPLSGTTPRSTLLAEPAPGQDTSAPSNTLLLSPAGTFAGSQMHSDAKTMSRQGNLAVAIRQRIESRIGQRIHNLSVRVSGNTIVLEGRCATYYSKQLAQHAALGILEDESLENDIVVAVAD